MFSPADAALAERDSGLPGLQLLLDPVAFREELRREQPALNVQGIEFHYVRYKPRTNIISAFTLDLDGAPVSGYAKAYCVGDWDKLMKAEQRPHVHGPHGLARTILPGSAIEVAFFPNDNKLRYLGRLIDHDSRAAFLARVFDTRPDLQAGTIHPLRYKPERRFVGRVDIDGVPRAVLKLYTPRAYAAARVAAETLCSGDELLGRSSRYSSLAFEWHAGANLIDSMGGPIPSLEIVERIGAALAEFHSRDGHRLPIRDRDAEKATIRATAEGLRFLHPSSGRLVSELAGTLLAELHDASSVRKPIHGDFYDRQVLVNQGEIVILDLDEAVLSDPAADLGLFIAHLEREALSRDLPAERVAPVRDALLAGYGCSPERVDLYTAIGLLQLAPHHFRNREPGWPERIEATLDRALMIVSRRVMSVA